MPKASPRAVLAKIIVAGNLNRLEPYILTVSIIGFALAVNVLMPYLTVAIWALMRLGGGN